MLNKLTAVSDGLEDDSAVRGDHNIVFGFESSATKKKLVTFLDATALSIEDKSFRALNIY